MLHVVRGDVFEFSILLCSIDLDLIEKIEFISKRLNICERAERDGDSYRVKILGERTKEFPLGFSKYNVIVTLIDGGELTVRCDKVEVLMRVVRNE